jgi:hypothetical protein
MHEAEYSGAREASPEERAFHAQQSNGDRPNDFDPQPSAEPARESAPPAEPREPREPRQENTQAPLDLPPPPPAKPFVVWSSSPTDAPGNRRDD